MGWDILKLSWLLFVVALCFPTCVRSADTIKPEVMTISYVNHPYIVKRVLPLLKEAYEDIGINVDFVRQPSKRNLRLLSKGLTDADAAYSDLLVAEYDNITTVGPAFLDSIFVLLCHSGVPCSKDVLFDSENTVIITDASQDGVKAIFGEAVNARFYSINSLDRIPKLIDGERANYGVYVFTKSGLANAQFPTLNAVELFITQTYHVIHKRHAHLVKSLDRAIRKAQVRHMELQP